MGGAAITCCRSRKIDEDVYPIDKKERSPLKKMNSSFFQQGFPIQSRIDTLEKRNIGQALSKDGITLEDDGEEQLPLAFMAPGTYIGIYKIRGLIEKSKRRISYLVLNDKNEERILDQYKFYNYEEMNSRMRVLGMISSLDTRVFLQIEDYFFQGELFNNNSLYYLNCVCKTREKVTLKEIKMNILNSQRVYIFKEKYIWRFICSLLKILQECILQGVVLTRLNCKSIQFVFPDNKKQENKEYSRLFNLLHRNIRFKLQTIFLEVQNFKKEDAHFQKGVLSSARYKHAEDILRRGDIALRFDSVSCIKGGVVDDRKASKKFLKFNASVFFNIGLLILGLLTLKKFKEMEKLKYYDLLEAINDLPYSLHLKRFIHECFHSFNRFPRNIKVFINLAEHFTLEGKKESIIHKSLEPRIPERSSNKTDDLIYYVNEKFIIFTLLQAQTDASPPCLIFELESSNEYETSKVTRKIISSAFDAVETLYFLCEFDENYKDSITSKHNKICSVKIETEKLIAELNRKSQETSMRKNRTADSLNSLSLDNRRSSKRGEESFRKLKLVSLIFLDKNFKPFEINWPKGSKQLYLTGTSIEEGEESVKFQIVDVVGRSVSTLKSFENEGEYSRIVDFWWWEHNMYIWIRYSFLNSKAGGQERYIHDKIEKFESRDRNETSINFSKMIPRYSFLGEKIMFSRPLPINKDKMLILFEKNGDFTLINKTGFDDNTPSIEVRISRNIGLKMMSWPTSLQKFYFNGKDLFFFSFDAEDNLILYNFEYIEAISYFILNACVNIDHLIYEEERADAPLPSRRVRNESVIIEHRGIDYHSARKHPVPRFLAKTIDFDRYSIKDNMGDSQLFEIKNKLDHDKSIFLLKKIIYFPNEVAQDMSPVEAPLNHRNIATFTETKKLFDLCEQKKEELEFFGIKAFYGAIDTLSGALEVILFLDKIDDNLEKFLSEKKEPLFPEEMIRIFRKIVSGVDNIEKNPKNSDFYKKFSLKDVYLEYNAYKKNYEYKINILSQDDRKVLKEMFPVFRYYDFKQELLEIPTNVESEEDRTDRTNVYVDEYVERLKNFASSIYVVGLMMFLITFPSQIASKQSLNLNKIKIFLQKEREEKSRPEYILDLLEAILVKRSFKTHSDILSVINQTKKNMYLELKLEKFLQSKEVFRTVDSNKKYVFCIMKNDPYLVMYNSFSNEIRNYKLLLPNKKIYSGLLVLNYAVNDDSRNIYAFGKPPIQLEDVPARVEPREGGVVTLERVMKGTKNVPKELRDIPKASEQVVFFKIILEDKYLSARLISGAQPAFLNNSQQSYIPKSLICYKEDILFQIGGEFTNSKYSNRASTECHKYDGTSNTWISIGNLKTERKNPGLFIENNRIFCFGGESLLERQNNKHSANTFIEAFNIVNGTWEELLCKDSDYSLRNIFMEGIRFIVPLQGGENYFLLNLNRKSSVILSLNVDKMTGMCFSDVKVEDWDNIYMSKDADSVEQEREENLYDKDIWMSENVLMEKNKISLVLFEQKYLRVISLREIPSLIKFSWLKEIEEWPIL